jgi:hypothetical protein
MNRKERKMADTAINLNNVRLSYVYIFGEGRTNDSGKRSWSLTALIPKNSPQVPAIKAAIDAAKAKDAQKLGKTGIKSPLLDGDTKDEDGGYKYKGDENRGCYLIRASNYNRRPAVVDKSVQPIIDPDEVYSGCYANVRVSFYGYNSGTNKGISPGLEAVQKIKDGERLSGGGANPSDIFTAVEEDFLS